MTASGIRNVLVLGAPADQGIPLVGALKAAGFAPTAGVRRADAMAGTLFPDLPVVAADIVDVGSLEAAMAGQDALAMHLPFEFDRERAAGFGRNIAEAAKRAGLRKIVFNTSCFVADRDLGLSAHDGRRDIERVIVDSGIPYVFIEPVVFMDNIVRPWSKPSIVARGIFAYPAADDLKISWISLADVAAFMVAALGTDAADGCHVAVGGPEALTGHEVAEKLAVAAGKPVRFQSLTPDEFAARMSELVTGSRDVAPHSIYDGMAQFYRWYNAQPISPLVVDPEAFTALLPVPLTPFSEWAARQDWSKPV
ncbi:NmrA family NAD(P)-binding protein [Parasphingopyxis algicola]|uniref:SDR family oxidoreductase n=1 Tax=Parasphingopyxis algicola TaxID=2026624 RepID=UPI0015A43945|nr:NmrA family NAD(P)-binding protein [Parasphingopyxis algicola]QLC25419.1 NmrA family NAD(P)-binding protein [Parasphingopyxis algicola]